tara:strand:+ start:296 stop:1999 length:1704 start_codon:yes stop_codon:yes gene_type:complete
MFLLRAILQGIKSLMLYPLRSMLTVLGLIFGVCSVIAMLAIGEGQKQKAEEEIKKLGAINVIIASQKPIEQEVQGQQQGYVAEYGVKWEDLRRIALLDGVVRVLPEKIRKENVVFDKFYKKDRQVFGTWPTFLEFSQAEVVMGRFLSEEDESQKSKVCVISTTLASELFAHQNPLNHEIRVGEISYRVVGLVRTPADLIQDEKEHRQRQFDESTKRQVKARLEAELAANDRLIESRRRQLKEGNATEQMVTSVIDQEGDINASHVVSLNRLPPILLQARIEDQDTPEAKWFIDQSGRIYFVTPKNWIYEANGTNAKLQGNLAHGRVKRMAVDQGINDKESELSAQNEFYGDVYIPFATARAYYGDIEMKRQSGAFTAKEVQIDRLRVQFDTMDNVIPGARMVERTMRFGHKPKEDYVIRVPLDELETARKINLIFTIVLATIASISLVVGGIGIMNIMLATVTERTNEIGIRRALGARKTHIIWQFLVETSVLSVVGGLLGIVLGYTAPLFARWILQSYYQYELVIIFTTWSVALAFGISVCIGIIFGIYPAIRAANLDPIEALRHT